MTAVGNLFAPLPAAGADEVFTALLSCAGTHISRIVSNGQASPPGYWYDQPHGEWVLVLQGAARLQFEGASGTREMKPGDFVDIPAHRRHRVEWTDPDQATVWLAVHYGADPG